MTRSPARRCRPRRSRDSRTARLEEEAMHVFGEKVSDAITPHSSGSSRCVTSASRGSFASRWSSDRSQSRARHDQGAASTRLHEQTYGYSVLAEPVEIVNIGLTAIGRLDRPAVRRRHREPAVDAPGALPSARRCTSRRLGGSVDCQVYDRYLLDQGSADRRPCGDRGDRFDDCRQPRLCRDGRGRRNARHPTHTGGERMNG